MWCGYGILVQDTCGGFTDSLVQRGGSRPVDSRVSGGGWIFIADRPHSYRLCVRCDTLSVSVHNQRFFFCCSGAHLPICTRTSIQKSTYCVKNAFCIGPFCDVPCVLCERGLGKQWLKRDFLMGQLFTSLSLGCQ